MGRAALSETMRQLKYANAKVLGFVFNSVDDSTLPYNKKYYRKGYYKGTAITMAISMVTDISR